MKRWYAERKEMQQKMRDCADNEIEKEYWDKGIKYISVEIKLTIVCFDLKFNLGNIFSPTSGNTPKNTQSDLSITSWLFFAIVTYVLMTSFLASYGCN